MQTQFLIKISTFIHDVQIYAAVLLGAVIQYLMSESKSKRVLVVIITASVFVAWFIVPMFIEILNIGLGALKIPIVIKDSGKIAVGIYALSTLISVELIAIFVKLAPKAAQNKINSYLGIKLGDKDDSA